MRPLSVQEPIEKESLPAQRVTYVGTRVGTMEALRSISVVQLAILYAIAIGCAEVLTTYASPLLGLSIHLLVFTASIFHGAIEPRPKAMALWLSISLVPLIRIVSLGLPLGAVSLEWWYVLAGLPPLAAAITAVRVLGFSRRQIGLQLPTGAGWLLTIIVISTGVVIGMAEFSLIGQVITVEASTTGQLVLFGSILILGTGVVEEVVFRGVLQTAAMAALGTTGGIVLVSVLFAVMHTGHGSILNVWFIFGVSLYFGYVRYVTGSLLAVIAAHSVANLVLLILAS